MCQCNVIAQSFRQSTASLGTEHYGDDPVEPKAIGYANLSSPPIGGWPDGSVGDALENAVGGGELPVSSSATKSRCRMTKPVRFR